jgi:hypothetical protein
VIAGGAGDCVGATADVRVLTLRAHGAAGTPLWTTNKKEQNKQTKNKLIKNIHIGIWYK